MKEKFLQPRFVGARFEEHTLPLEVARDLAVYEDLISELAKRLYLQDHPERQRVPRGFGADFQLHLERVDEGSARPLLSIVTSGALALGTPGEPYFERARDLVYDCIQAPPNQLPSEFPRDLLSYFNRFGRSLRDDERLEMPGRTGEAVLTPAKRRELVLAADQVYQRDIELHGSIEEADFKTKTFRLRLLDGGHAIVPIPDNFSEIARDLNGRPRHLVVVKGVGSYDSWEKLQKVVEVETISTLKNFSLSNKIEEISELKNGWYDGVGLAPSTEALDRIARFLVAHYPEKLEIPAIVPTPDGNLLLEWATAGNPSLDISLDTLHGEYHSFGPNGEDLERDFPLDNKEDWDTLFAFLTRAIIPKSA